MSQPPADQYVRDSVRFLALHFILLVMGIAVLSFGADQLLNRVSRQHELENEPEQIEVLDMQVQRLQEQLSDAQTRSRTTHSSISFSTDSLTILTSRYGVRIVRVTRTLVLRDAKQVAATNFLFQGELVQLVELLHELETRYRIEIVDATLGVAAASRNDLLLQVSLTELP